MTSAVALEGKTHRMFLLDGDGDGITRPWRRAATGALDRQHGARFFLHRRRRPRGAAVGVARQAGADLLLGIVLPHVPVPGRRSAPPVRHLPRLRAGDRRDLLRHGSVGDGRLQVRAPPDLADVVLRPSALGGSRRSPLSRARHRRLLSPRPVRGAPPDLRQYRLHRFGPRPPRSLTLRGFRVLGRGEPRPRFLRILVEPWAGDERRRTMPNRRNLIARHASAPLGAATPAAAVALAGALVLAGAAWASSHSVNISTHDDDPILSCDQIVPTFGDHGHPMPMARDQRRFTLSGSATPVL